MRIRIKNGKLHTRAAYDASETFACSCCGLHMSKHEARRLGACPSCGRGTMCQSLAMALAETQVTHDRYGNLIDWQAQNWLDAKQRAQTRDENKFGCSWAPEEV